MGNLILNSPGFKVCVWAGVFFAAILMGYELGTHHAPPAPPARVVEVPKYIQPKDRVIEKKVMPEACKNAVKAAATMRAATDKYEAAVGELPQIIDDAGVALFNQDRAKLNDLRERQTKLQADSIQALLDLREAQQRLNDLQPKCDAALK
jgi:hypothetical protein